LIDKFKIVTHRDAGGFPFKDETEPTFVWVLWDVDDGIFFSDLRGRTYDLC
jgi:hypothetical protein